jgi:predicted NUDIX family NTP pyrophosphohydrolase
MNKRSAGILLFRRTQYGVEVFLIHPGGPFWAKKDAWSIPKGEYERDEDPLAAARREFHEETGSSIDGHFIPLDVIRQPGGKEVIAWAIEGDFDPATLVSNTCQVEWPPRTGRMIEIPEVDRGAWFPIAIAEKKNLPRPGILPRPPPRRHPLTLCTTAPRHQHSRCDFLRSGT